MPWHRDKSHNISRHVYEVKTTKLAAVEMHSASSHCARRSSQRKAGLARFPATAASSPAGTVGCETNVGI